MPTLNPTKLSAEDEMLRDLRKRIVEWQLRSGKSVYWMPKALWEEAVAAAQLCGIKRAARGMGLEFDDLNNRVRMVEPHRSPSKTNSSNCRASPP